MTTDDAIRIASEAGLRYSALQGFVVDPRLWHYVPRSLARRERVVPVILVGDVLTIASTHAAPDLSMLATSLPRLSFELVIAPAPEIDRLLEEA